MKIKGVELHKLPDETVVFIHSDQEIVFKLKAVTDWSQCEKLLPEPTPPMRMVKGKKEANYQDVNYKKQLEDFSNKRFAWMMIESLSATPDIEWEIVDPQDPNTWLKWTDELLEVLLPAELTQLTQGMLRANALDTKHMEEARKAFLARQEATQSDQSGNQAEQTST